MCKIWSNPVFPTQSQRKSFISKGFLFLFIELLWNFSVNYSLTHIYRVCFIELLGCSNKMGNL